MVGLGVVVDVVVVGALVVVDVVVGVCKSIISRNRVSGSFFNGKAMSEVFTPPPENH